MTGVKHIHKDGIQRSLNPADRDFKTGNVAPTSGWWYGDWRDIDSGIVLNPTLIPDQPAGDVKWEGYFYIGFGVDRADAIRNRVSYPYTWQQWYDADALNYPSYDGHSGSLGWLYHAMDEVAVLMAQTGRSIANGHGTPDPPIPNHDNHSWGFNVDEAGLSGPGLALYDTLTPGNTNAERPEGIKLGSYSHRTLDGPPLSAY